jgi:hypothetical protein
MEQGIVLVADYFSVSIEIEGLIDRLGCCVGPMMPRNVSLILGAVSVYAAEFHRAKHP